MSIIRGVGFGLVVGVGCSSGGAAPDGGGGGDGGPQSDLGIDLPVGQDGPMDSTGFEPAPLPYFYGTCRFGSAASLVPTDRGQLPYGLTVLARRLGWGRLTFAVGAALIARPAEATTCSLAMPIVHVVDPAMQATDQTPPTLSALPPATIARGHAPRQDGCAASAMSCDDVGTISFPAAATDDTTLRERIGYRLSLSGGTLPAGLTLPTDAIEPGAQLEIFVSWDDGATDKQEPIDFALSIVAIDAAGNESAPQTLRVSNDPGCSCAVAGPHTLRNGLIHLIIAALLLNARRRQRFRSRVHTSR